MFFIGADGSGDQCGGQALYRAGYPLYAAGEALYRGRQALYRDREALYATDQALYRDRQALYIPEYHPNKRAAIFRAVVGSFVPWTSIRPSRNNTSR